MLGVEIAAGERVVATAGELADERWRGFWWVQGESSGKAPSVISVWTRPGLRRKTGSRPASSFASVSPYGQTAALLGG